MIESGYYPDGAEFDPNAPYNQKDNDAVPIDVEITYTITKKQSIDVDDYYAEEYNDIEYEDGEKVYYRGIDYDFSHCNLLEAYNRMITLTDIINECKKLALIELDRHPNDSARYRYLKEIIDLCNGWEVNDIDITLDK